MTAWAYRKWGSREDPIRQSTVLRMVGEGACWSRVQRDRELDLAGAPAERDRAPWRRVIGNAVHLGIARYLEHAAATARVLTGETPSFDACRTVVQEAIPTAAEGLPVEWSDADAPAEIDSAAHMVRGALSDLAARAVAVVAVEAPFLAQLGRHWISGTVDLVYRPRAAPESVAIADWKTGQQRQPQIVLDHNWQLAIYTHAVRAGEFYPDSDRSLRLDATPSESWVVHLRDHVPYARKSTKTIDRPEEALFWGRPRGGKITLEKGERRGPAWYRASEPGAQRLDYLVRKIVAAVRLGTFVPFVGEHCVRCPHREPCLSDGHAPEGDLARDLERSLRGVDLAGTGADEIAA